MLVTHDMHSVERFCDRAMLIERGQVIDVGDPHVIARAYNEINFGRLVHDSPGGPRYGDRTAGRDHRGWFETADGERTRRSRRESSSGSSIEVRFHATLDEPIFGLTLRNEVGHTIFATRTDYRGVATGSYAVGDVAVVRSRWTTGSPRACTG